MLKGTVENVPGCGCGRGVRSAIRPAGVGAVVLGRPVGRDHLLLARSIPGERPLHEIPVDNIRSVELVDEALFKKKNMLRIVQPDRDLYIQVSVC